jgi:hypothetical protein
VALASSTTLLLLQVLSVPAGYGGGPALRPYSGRPGGRSRSVSEKCSKRGSGGRSTVRSANEHLHGYFISKGHIRVPDESSS